MLSTAITPVCHTIGGDGKQQLLLPTEVRWLSSRMLTQLFELPVEVWPFFMDSRFEL